MTVSVMFCVSDAFLTVAPTLLHVQIWRNAMTDARVGHTRRAGHCRRLQWRAIVYNAWNMFALHPNLQSDMHAIQGPKWSENPKKIAALACLWDTTPLAVTHFSAEHRTPAVFADFFASIFSYSHVLFDKTPRNLLQPNFLRFLWNNLYIFNNNNLYIFIIIVWGI